MIENTLYGLLKSIDSEELVLPAMQRPFVWKEERLYRLIDSLLRGFPIGAVMLWKTSTAQRYRRFPRDIDNTIDSVFTFETSENNSNKYLVLDGQQRLTGLYCIFNGTYNNKILHINVLSGSPEDKDPGNNYYECSFLTPLEAQKINEDSSDVFYEPIKNLISIDPRKAAARAYKTATDRGLDQDKGERIADVYIGCASILGNSRSLQVITIDEDQQQPTPVEEILEIFVRVNSGGLVLQKSDLLMSLLDLTWNDIQPELQHVVREVNNHKPFQFSRDDILKSLLLAEGAETRFDRLVSDRNRINALGDSLPQHIAGMEEAWKTLACILTDECKIHSERFLRGGHNSLLPFVVYIYRNRPVSNPEKRRIVVGIYVVLMSGIFGSAESRMNSFTRKYITKNSTFPLEHLMSLVRRQYGIDSLDSLLTRSLDLTLNLTHGGISIDNNPDDLQRDHIFPRSKLLEAGLAHEVVNHYANFHFLRGSDNLNKLDKDPHDWFKTPGKGCAPYSDEDLEERLLTWNNLQPGNFELMLLERGAKIRKQASQILGFSEDQINALFNPERELVTLPTDAYA
jgi:hypothetical protein